MSNLKEKYHGKKLSTDEAATAMNEINAAIKELESIVYETGPDYLLLKWGTLKRWDFRTDTAKELLKQYHAIGSSASVMLQHDTPEQREIICKLIEECDGTIQNDWHGGYYTKEEAKAYVRGYAAPTQEGAS